MLPMVGFGQNFNMDDLEEEEIEITSPYKDSHKALKLGKEITKLKAELDSVTEELNSITLISIESMPTLARCQNKACTDSEMMKFIARNFKYPEIAKANGVQGTVYVEFVVEKCGHVDRVKILKGLSVEIDKEAIEVIRLLPKFQPGVQVGEPVPVRFTVPIKCFLG